MGFQLEDLFLLLAFSLGAFVMGLPVVRWADVSRGKDGTSEPLLVVFFAMATGLLIQIAALFALGMAGLLTPTAVTVVDMMLLGIAAAALHWSAGGVPAIPRALYPHLLFLALLFAALVAKSMRPPGAWDDTMYHLPLARSYVANAGIVLQPFLRFPLAPQNFELLFGLGLMIGGPVAAQGIAVLPLFVIAVGVLGYTRAHLGSVVPGYIAIVVMLAVPFVQGTLGYAYIDAGLAMFCWGAILAVGIWAADGGRSVRLAILAGALAGGAAGTKLFGLVIAGILFLYILAAAPRPRLRPAAAFAGTAFAVGCWWYLRSFAIAGDPIHPAGAPLFGYFLWSPADLANQIAEQHGYGVPRNPLYLPQSFVRAGVGVWLIALPLLLIFRRHAKSVQVLLVAFVGYYLFWFFVTQVDRYLAPILVAGSVLSGVAVWQMLRFVNARFVRITLTRRTEYAAVVMLVTLAAYKASSAVLAAQDKLDGWSADLDAQAGHRVLQRANAMRQTHGSRIVQIGFENAVYYFDGTVIGDWFGPGRYDAMRICRTPASHDPQSCHIRPAGEMAALMRRFDARMLAVNPTQIAIDLSDYRRDFDIAYRSDTAVLLALRRRSD